jgi:hypothetical protein
MCLPEPVDPECRLPDVLLKPISQPDVVAEVEGRSPTAAPTADSSRSAASPPLLNLAIVVMQPPHVHAAAYWRVMHEDAVRKRTTPATWAGPRHLGAS